MSDLNTRFILSLILYSAAFYFGYIEGYGDGEPSIMSGIIAVIFLFISLKIYSLIIRALD